MTDQNQNRDWQAKKLDEALAKFVSAEPRTGLDERVLANLRAESARVAHRAWWRRGSAVSAVAAVIVVMIALTWRFEKPSHPLVANRPSPMTRDEPRSGARDPAYESGNEAAPQQVRPRRKRTAPRSQPAVVAAAGEPKLDRFPSYQPLSEQEKMLTSYVTEYPDRAILVAQAQAEMLRQDREEELQKSGATGDSELQPHNQ